MSVENFNDTRKRIQRKLGNGWRVVPRKLTDALNEIHANLEYHEGELPEAMQKFKAQSFEQESSRLRFLYNPFTYRVLTEERTSDPYWFMGITSCLPEITAFETTRHLPANFPLPRSAKHFPREKYMGRWNVQNKYGDETEQTGYCIRPIDKGKKGFVLTFTPTLKIFLPFRFEKTLTSSAAFVNAKVPENSLVGAFDELTTFFTNFEKFRT